MRGKFVLGWLVVMFALATPGVARAQQPHAVTWDKYSLQVDGQRVFFWSGELHPFRLPNPDLWRDMLQKMKANGYNGVSIYVDWAVHSPKPGVYDFSGVRDMDKFLDIAAQEGLYVMARPGPYINAEVDAGGFPGWLTRTPGTARTSNATYMAYVDQYLTAIDAILARHQVTNGTGSVLVYQIENEYANNVNSATGIDYMKHLYDKVRADGITVPIFHNDKGRNGYWAPGKFTGNDGLPGPNLYGFDGYPGGTCSTSGNPGTPATPPDWGYFGTGGATGGATASPNTPGLIAEFGGGWFDPWGDKLFGGAGYDCLAKRQSSAYERDYYLTNVANGIKIQNIYMTFGGTNWGWLPAPVVYTSYDYGSAFNEARQARVDKTAPMKAMGYMVQSVAPMAKMDKVGYVTATDAAVRVYHLTNPDTGTHFYFPRHAAQTGADSKFTFPISTGDGDYTIPQSGALELNGEDMKALVADWDFDSQHLVYSTADVMTHGHIGDQDVLVVQGRKGQTGETVLRFAAQPTVDVLSGTGITSTWDAAHGDLRLDYPLNGLGAVRVGKLLLLMADDDAVATLWKSGPALVRGPSLVRSASVSGDTIALTGDTSSSAPLEVWAPAGVTKVTWNGAPVDVALTATGSLASAGSALAGPPAVTLPDLSGWKVRTESPEASPSFDDSSWAAADRTTSNSKTAVPAGQKVLFADDYGFHNGNVWYRGTYSDAATQVKLSYQTGTVGLLQAWLDGKYLGYNQTPIPTSAQATTATWAATATFDIPAELQTPGPHKLAVMVNMMGHEEDGGANDAFKNARGLTAASLVGSSAGIAFKIQGNQGGEDITDPVRGFVNASGLYGERAGWSLAGYPDSGWASASLPSASQAPGTSWYRTSFDLDVPAGVDASLGLNISDDATKGYRALIFVNGWNMGQYINDVGPQHTFVLPSGVLKLHGKNSIALAVTSDTGAGPGAVKLVNLGTVASSLQVGDVASPAFAAPQLTPLPVSGGAFSGPVAAITLPPDVQGAALDATIDWGDGTRTAGTVSGGFVSGAHTYTGTPARSVNVIVSDRYSGAALAAATGAVGGVGGSVPATLSLTLGAPASFGAFVPGVDRTYTASTTANVISTAGDATLSVSDPGHLTNGAFSLAEPLQVSLSKSSWTAPVSNDVVTVGFSQHIGATDPLRTGSYANTLTFTLSTTTP